MLDLSRVDVFSLKEQTTETLATQLPALSERVGSAAELAGALVDDLLEALQYQDANKPKPETKTRHLTGAHVRVLYLLSESQGSTDTQLSRRWTTKVARARDAWPFIADAGLRTRRAELVRWGLVEHSGAWGGTLNNHRSRIWQLHVPSRRPEELPPFDASAREALGLLLAEANDDLVQVQLLQDLERFA